MGLTQKEILQIKIDALNDALYALHTFTTWDGTDSNVNCAIGELQASHNYLVNKMVRVARKRKRG